MVEGGIGSIGEVRDLTFREVDYILQRQRKLVEDGWDYARHIMAVFSGKNPKNIIKLSRDPKPKVWTQEEAIETIKRMGGKWLK